MLLIASRAAQEDVLVNLEAKDLGRAPGKPRPALAPGTYALGTRGTPEPRNPFPGDPGAGGRHAFATGLQGPGSVMLAWSFGRLRIRDPNFRAALEYRCGPLPGMSTRGFINEHNGTPPLHSGTAPPRCFICIHRPQIPEWLRCGLHGHPSRGPLLAGRATPPPSGAPGMAFLGARTVLTPFRADRPGFLPLWFPLRWLWVHHPMSPPASGRPKTTSWPPLRPLALMNHWERRRKVCGAIGCDDSDGFVRSGKPGRVSPGSR